MDRLRDLFRSYFPATRYDSERLGPTELPSDIFNDLRNTPLHRETQPIGNHEDTELEGLPHHLDQNNRDIFGQSQHPQTFGSIGREFEDAFHQMDSMFKNFFGVDPSFDYIQGDPPMGGLDNREGKSLREKMLDDGNENSPFQHEDSHPGGFLFKFHTPFFKDIWQSPFHRGESPFDNHASGKDGKLEDKDLDNDYNSGVHSIDDILDSEVPHKSNNQSLFGFGGNLPSNGMSSIFKYSTVTKKVNPDGSVETTSRKRDSDGNEEVVVSRNLGEQTHTVTSKKNNQGEEEKIENFTNMDENDLETFDEKWKQKSQKNPRDMFIAPGKNDLRDFASWWKPKL